MNQYEVINKWAGEYAVIYSIKQEVENKPILAFYQKSKDPKYIKNQKVNNTEIENSNYYKTLTYHNENFIPIDVELFW